ncbi:MAG: ABC transporter permease [Sporichthyaceae bacterium]|nr:ABC transporter permease [Sporichthyaceae bacterium]
MVARRIVSSLGTLAGVAVLVFVVLRLIPGDQVTATLGTETGLLTDTQRRALEDYYGIGGSPFSQFASWLGSVLTGNFGYSVRAGEPVRGLLLDALPVTIELAVLATVIGAVVGVGVGVFAASKPDGARDALGQVVGLLGLAVPSFVVGSVLVTVLATQFSYFPSAGSYAQIWEDPWTNLQQMIFPALVLGFALAGTVMRTTRSAYLEIASRDFVRTARGRGASERRVRWRHIVRNALIPIVTITGVQFGYLLGGTVVVEQIFALPGLGQLILTGITRREYAVVQSAVLVVAVSFVLVNLLVDLLYTRIDPRVRFE